MAAGDIVAKVSLADEDFNKGIARMTSTAEAAESRMDALRAQVEERRRLRGEKNYRIFEEQARQHEKRQQELASAEEKRQARAAEAARRRNDWMRLLGAGVAGAVAIVRPIIQAVKDYADVSDRARDETAKFEAQMAASWRNIGRQSQYAVRHWEGVKVALAELYVKAVDMQAIKFRPWFQLGNPGERMADLIDAEWLEEAATSTRKLNESLVEIRANTQAIGGNKGEANRLAIEQERQKRMAAINAMPNLTIQQRDEAKRAIDAEATAKRRSLEQQAAAEAHSRKVADARRFSEMKKKAEEEKANRAEAKTALGFELDRLKVDDLRLAGKQKEADLLEAEIEARKRIYEISRDELLNQQDKAAAIDAINRNLTGRQAAINRGEEKIEGVSGSLAVGLAGVAGLSRQVFGGGTSDRDAAFQKKVVQLMEEFKRGLNNPRSTMPMAVYGP